MGNQVVSSEGGTRRRPSRPQYSLRTFLLVATGLGIFVGSVGSSYFSRRDERRVVNQIDRIGGKRVVRDRTKTVAVFLAGTRTDDDILAAISRTCPEIETMILSRTLVTDRGVASIARLRRLRVLWLDATSVGDQSLAFVGRIPNLTELRVDDTKISATAIERLRRERPLVNIVVVHPDGT